MKSICAKCHKYSNVSALVSLKMSDALKGGAKTGNYNPLYSIRSRKQYLPSWVFSSSPSEECVYV